MLTPLTVILACLAWAAVLFGVALWGERNASRLVRIWPVVYTLSLAVHCTAWTYYGAVAQAVRWDFFSPPTYLGIVLLLVFVVLLVNAAVDISYALIDPRLRSGGRS